MAKNKFYDGPGLSQRQLRVGELIRRTLAQVLAQEDLHHPDMARTPTITVSEVTTSPDLKIATAYVMPLGGGDHAQALAFLNDNRGQLRRIVGRKLALKFTPKLRFRIDETFDRMDKTRELLNLPKVRQDLEG